MCESPFAASRVPTHWARETPGTRAITSFTSQKSRWCVMSPCSLKDSRDIIRSLLCRGDGKDSDVPGIGREGITKGGGSCEALAE